MALAFASGSGGGSGGGVSSVTAGDTSIVVGGTAANPTVETGTLDVIAADHPPAGAVALNSQKITGLAAGVAATDAANVGQLPAASTPGLVKLFEQTLASAAASIDTGANGIAAGHEDLICYILARTADSAAVAGVQITVNGDTGAHYDQQWEEGAGTTVSANTSLARANWQFGTSGNTALAGYAGNAMLFIPAYDATTFNKVANMQGTIAATVAGNNQAIISIFGWRSTAAINQLTVTGATANLLAGSRLVVYGAQ